jgi:hypothetical protein
MACIIVGFADEYTAKCNAIFLNHRGKGGMHRGAKSIFEPQRHKAGTNEHKGLFGVSSKQLAICTGPEPQRHKAGTKEHKVFFYVFLCFLPTITYQQPTILNLQVIRAFPAN